LEKVCGGKKDWDIKGRCGRKAKNQEANNANKTVRVFVDRNCHTRIKTDKSNETASQYEVRSDKPTTIWK
jgi:type IV secretory pathway VirD2 relaxase